MNRRRFGSKPPSATSRKLAMDETLRMATLAAFERLTVEKLVRMYGVSEKVASSALLTARLERSVGL